jgi:tetratricopeptide (TPR) repeat protein
VRRLGTWTIVTATLVAAAVAVPLSADGLTAPARLANAYDLILDARFAEAADALEPCAPAPAIACDVLDVTALLWLIQLDPDSLALDAQFSAEVETVVAAAEAWTEREPDRAEAWFYLGGAYGARVQWRVLRGERLAAARDGKRIKDALERALDLDPSLADARFGIGLYKYYADMAPTLAKIFRFLLLLPGGDREAGLRDMIEARDHGVLLRGEADYQLHWIYLWYEEQPARSLALLERLHRRHPHNPVFRQRIAEVQVEYFHDRGAALATWLALMADARAGRVAEPRLALTRARIGAALELDARFETDRAVELLRAVVQARPTAPYGSFSHAALLLGRTCDRLGRRVEAVEAYRTALAAVPDRDVFSVRAAARAGLREEPDNRRAQAFSLSLQGWRAFERGALEDAEQILDRSLALDASAPVTWYRRGRVYQARHDREHALAAFDRVITSRPIAPAVVLAPAYVHRGEILESRGDRTGATAAFHAAARVFGADAADRERATRAIARLDHPVTQR